MAVLCIVACCTGLELKSQSSPQSSLFSQNVLAFNPAYAGSKLGVHVDGSLRYQWVDLEGAPVSQFLSGHVALPGIKAGIGLSLYNDAIGAENNISARFAFSKTIKTRFGNIFGGLELGIAQKSLNGAELISNDGSYSEVIEHNDDLLPNGRNSGMAPDLGFGLLFQRSKTMIGISARSLLNRNYDLGETGTIVESKATFYGYAQQLVELGYNIDLVPSLLIKSDLVSQQLDFQVAAIYREMFQFGLGFRGYNNRTEDAVILMAGYHFTADFMLLYSYDIGVSGLNTVQSGSHELGISYRISSLLANGGGKVIYNPRFL